MTMEITEKNKTRTGKMVKMRLSGLTYKQIGEEFNLTKQRTCKIISKYLNNNKEL